MQAARCGHHHCVKALLYAGADVNRANRLHDTSFIYAVSNQQYRAMRQLVAAGTDVNIRWRGQGNTAVIVAVIRNNFTLLKVCVTRLLKVWLRTHGDVRVLVNFGRFSKSGCARFHCNVVYDKINRDTI